MLGAGFRASLKKRCQKNFLLNLLNEMNDNLERYFVIDQRQFISMGFEMVAWDEARHFSGLQFPPELDDYAVALEDFNRAFADSRAFEEDYSSSIDHKTLESAQVLHAKKEALAEKFKVIQPKIICAQKVLRVMMEKRF